MSTGYANWVTIVSSAKNRIANPTMRKTGIVHRPAQNPSLMPRQAGTSYNFSNWSGLGVTASSNYFMANGSTVVGTFSVPSIVSDVEDCSYVPYIASIWVGFDGYAGTGDVLQAGINAQACASPAYYAWYEWYTPGCSGSETACDETSVNLTVDQGDTIIVTVTYYTSSPNGNAFISDFTTGYYVSVSYNQPNPDYPSPNPYAYQGNSAEWVVERPMSGGSLVNLTDYGSGFYMEGTYNANLPGTGPANSPDTFNMYCDSSYPWSPSSACTSFTYLSSMSSYNSSSGEISFIPSGPTVTYH
jgi:hypothetical protein